MVMVGLVMAINHFWYRTGSGKNVNIQCGNVRRVLDAAASECGVRRAAAPSVVCGQKWEWG